MMQRATFENRYTSVWVVFYDMIATMLVGLLSRASSALSPSYRPEGVFVYCCSVIT